MKLSVRVVVHPDDEDSEATPVVREVFALDRDTDHLSPDTLGLRLVEAQDLLAGVQDAMVDHQVQRAVTGQVPFPECGTARRHKDTRQIVVRSLFGVLRLQSPRWWHCDCRPQPTRTFQPLARLLSERTTPELGYLQARFAGLVSYGVAAKLLGELLPLGRRLHAGVVCRQTHAVAARLEDELGEERFSFIDTCQAQRDEMPRPEMPLTVGLDGGYVHSAAQRSRRDGWFEVIVGKVIPAQGKASCFGYVQTYDTKPKRRLFEALRAHGMTDNQQVTFLTDGGEDIRDLPCYLNSQGEHLLDWFHITMRITVMTNMARSLAPPSPPDPDLELTAEGAHKLIREVRNDLERLKWLLWHGNLFRALTTVDGLIGDLEHSTPASSRASCSSRRASSTASCARTPAASPTTANAAAPVRPSPPRSPSPQSIR